MISSNSGPSSFSEKILKKCFDLAQFAPHTGLPCSAYGLYSGCGKGLTDRVLASYGGMVDIRGSKLDWLGSDHGRRTVRSRRSELFYIFWLSNLQEGITLFESGCLGTTVVRCQGLAGDHIEVRRGKAKGLSR